ncbi:Translation initiation factor 3 subunit J component [Coemansia erecta]|nr:Translation initiation factor 3 subunit J component [Coemansia erecta]
MSTWEDQESGDEIVQNVVKSKWDDEDADGSDEAPEAWDASSDSEAEAGVSVPAPQPKKKKTVAERIAEKQAEREAKKAEIAVADSDDSDEDAVAKKLRQRQLEIDSDRQAAEDLFAGITIKDAQAKDVLTHTPKTQDEFDEFQKALFLEKLVRELALPLKDSEVRTISSALNALASEKQKASRDLAKGKKKNKKATLGGVQKTAEVDMADYSRGYDKFDDFDDFM